MPEKDADTAAARIAAALVPLRARRAGGPGAHGPGAHGHGPHGGHGGRGPAGPRGPLGRGVAGIRLLEALADAAAPLSVSELAERIGVDQPRASRLVQGAVDAGHVHRQANEADARRTDILLTEQGRALVAQTRRARRDAVEQALEGFTDAEAEQLAQLLTRFAAAWPRG